MKHRKHMNNFVGNPIEDQIGEAAHDCHSNSTMDNRIRFRLSNYTLHASVNASEQVGPKALASGLIPVNRISQLFLGSWSKDDSH